LGPESFGDLHRVDHVGEEHGDLLPLALQRTTGDEDLLDQVARRVGPRLARTVARPTPRKRLTARIAEPLPRPVQAGTVATGDHTPARPPGLPSDAPALPVLVSAGGTPHGQVRAPL